LFGGCSPDELVARLAAGELPPDAEVKELLRRAAAHLKSLPTLVEAEVPVGASLHVVGDLHGQLAELVSVLKISGLPVSGRNLLLFNGDFVDRGRQSVEVVLILFALVLEFADCVFLNRGNHEARAMNRAYGFEEEVMMKYSRETFEDFQSAFVQLPLATLVNRCVLVVHGGLPARDGVKLSDLAALPRGGDQLTDIARDLLWADPAEEDGRPASQRGGGIRLFGPDVTKRFCTDNGLLCCVRSHEVVMRGFAWQRGRRCLTVFSAANYVGRAGNLGAVCHIRPSADGRVDVADISFTTFDGAPPRPPVQQALAPHSRL